MKLAQKYNRANLYTSLLILVLSGAVYYFAIHYILTQKLDHDLKIEEEEIVAYARKYKKLPIPNDFKDQRISYELLEKGAQRERYYSHNLYFKPDEREAEPGRSLITTIRLEGDIYRVSITKSSLEAEDLVRLIFLITLSVIVILLLSLMVINRFLLNSLWRPFHETLKHLKAFNLADANEFSVQPTEIDEFEELNQSVLVMAKRARHDYKELKSFTDNASHEMMTPLAVINSKLDTLIQTEALSDKQGELIEDVYLAVSRLSRLNQSLLLLAKIENRLIEDEEKIEFGALISLKIRQFKELLQANSIQVIQQLEYREVYMNKHLADILMNNLISNAIRHNNDHGNITIQLNQDGLSVCNTGSPIALDASKAFERFYKDASSEGSGLGLAISTQICNLYGFKLDYLYVNPQHIFRVEF
ncbi:sensor histidine kinase KdpD [Pedobacter sp. L105]|uniref:sensor histidine kinase n=1 Tax=Pedobacter sp. L105 TaxID=1641871 RepID=UPI00131D4D05|nr:HAMP domain-containing sensor histidine kinase [Pedobacter sp. L105]